MGLLLYRLRPHLEMLIVHPGGPFWANRDEGAWSIPKGLLDAGEDPLRGARREFEEETGLPTPETGYLSLGRVEQRGGKTVYAWAVEGDADADRLKSNTFAMEWPPGSERRAVFPEVDRYLWASPETARRKLNPAQTAFVDRLARR